MITVVPYEREPKTVLSTITYSIPHQNKIELTPKYRHKSIISESWNPLQRTLYINRLEIYPDNTNYLESGVLHNIIILSAN